ncbi:DnaJ domain-containing protein [Campylobacter sp. RM12642]|nr:DnaJ domain-containing protein [Campylobacter sp. RM12642]
MQSLLYCASIDGFSEKKIFALKEIAEIFGVTQEFAQFINFGNNNKQNNNKIKKDPYEVLELSSNASLVEVKAAYRRLAKKYHPDVLNTKNLSESELRAGIEKFHEINEAYEILKQKLS